MKNPSIVCPCIILNYDWNKLVSVFYNGLGNTGFDEADHTIDDDNEQSLSLQCSIALSFLSQIAKDPLLDVTFQYVSALLEHSQKNQAPEQ